MSEPQKTISREALYEQLWTVPISRLATQLGYSYAELVKICVGLNIPRPTGGYWSRLQHGGNSEQVPLPPAPAGIQTTIPLGPRVTDAHSQPSSDVPEAESPELSMLVETHGPKALEISDPLPLPGSSDSAKPAVAKQPLARVAPKFPECVEMTRDELYKHVWTTPIQILSEALGLSDVGLAKTCTQMEVPRPGRGYWARLDAGESVEQIPLPKASVNASTKWTFYVKLNRQRRLDWAAANVTAPSKANSVPPISLPSEQETLHEIAVRHREALGRAKQDENGFVRLDMQGLFECQVSIGLISKLVRAIHALVVELEKAGCRFIRGETKNVSYLNVAKDNERLTVRWSEALVEFEREPTNEEKRKPSWTWQLKQRRATGQLSIEVSAPGLRGQRSWTESESKPIEQMLARVIEKIAATFEGLHAQRLREAEREKQRIEDEKHRAEQEAKREVERREKERIAQHQAKLNEIAQVRRTNLWIAAQRWEDSQRALAYIDAIEKRWRSSSNELPPAQEQWLAWARAEAENLAPWAENYPDAESAKLCEPANIPMGGPYPPLRKLKATQVSHPEPKPEPPPFSGYGYSRY